MDFQPNVILIDGTSYIYRAFHALPPLTTSAGKPTGATRGFAAMLNKLIKTYPEIPMVMVFDAKGKNFRNDYYEKYKANRPPMPNELRHQIEDIKKLCGLFNFTVQEVEDVEADDVIATLVSNFSEDKILISSPDKDLTQLVNENVIQHNSMSDIFFDENGVKEKFGVFPNKVAELLALVGDKSDNIPGITKVGEKTAAKWLNEYGSLDEVIKNAENITGKVGENLREEKNVLQRNFFLVSLKNDINLGLQKSDISIPKANSSGLQEFYRSLEFNTFIEHEDNKSAGVEYKSVKSLEELERLSSQFHNCDYFSFDTETTSLDVNIAQIVGFSFCFESGKAFYVPLEHNESTDLSKDVGIKWLKEILPKNSSKLIGQNLKYDLAVLSKEGIYLESFLADTMLMSYVLNSTATRHNLDALSEYYLNFKTIKYEDVIGKGAKKYKSFADVPIKEATNYAAEDADITLRLYEKLCDLLDEGAQDILKKMEYPLLIVLMQMEKDGARVDTGHLKKLSNNFGDQLMKLAKKIHDASGSVFNIDSPKQLSEVLFEKLKIETKGLKKTSTGYYSTSESVLQKLANENPIVKDILNYRSLAKLKSTYTDKLSEICDASSRVHTSYQQAVTSTGRLSSSEPNLQNIPIRTPEGVTIREAFVASEGKKILAMDYSQIELRLMAHYSKDQIMLDSFKNNEDIHKRTASEVFSVEMENVTDEMRRRAKTINFGLLYGMSAFGLSNQLSVSRAEAEEFLLNYFAKYSSIKVFMKDVVEQAKKDKYVSTLYGRKIHVPNIESPNYMLRQSSERAAVNGPLQGSAADIIKRAMINIFKESGGNEKDIKMILQVHDELVFEVPEDYDEKNISYLIDLMEESSSIDVPLKVEYGFGSNWREAH